VVQENNAVFGGNKQLFALEVSIYFFPIDLFHRRVKQKLGLFVLRFRLFSQNL
jgi:hypothetical protein